jgi:hypothetical protein
MEQADTSEQRHDHRKGFLKRAQIVIGGGGVVENLSATGARVRLVNPTALPDTFALRFHDGASHAARRRWSLGTAVGIEFEGGGPAAESERRHTGPKSSFCCCDVRVLIAIVDASPHGRPR